MKTSDYVVKRIVSSPTTPDKVSDLARLHDVKSEDRHELSFDSSLSDILTDAESPNKVLFESVINNAFNDAIPQSVINESYANLTPENIIRMLDTSDVAIERFNVDGRQPIEFKSGNVPVLATVVAEYRKKTKSGSYVMRGKCIDITLPDGELIDTWDVATNRHGQIQLRSYGIGALWALIQDAMRSYALSEAREVRANTNHYCKVTYRLEKLADGETVMGTSN